MPSNPNTTLLSELLKIKIHCISQFYTTSLKSLCDNRALQSLNKLILTDKKNHNQTTEIKNKINQKRTRFCIYIIGKAKRKKEKGYRFFFYPEISRTFDIWHNRDKRKMKSNFMLHHSPTNKRFLPPNSHKVKNSLHKQKPPHLNLTHQVKEIDNNNNS